MFDKPEDIKSLRQKLHLTQEELASKLNLTKQYVSNVEKGTKKLNKEKLAMIKKIYEAADMPLEDKMVSIDYYPETFAICINGSYVLSDNKHIRTISAALLPRYSTGYKYSVCVARGNSMHPTIKNGNLVIVRHYENEQISDNDLYIFCYKDEIFIKRLTKNINMLVIDSDNPAYEQITLKKDEIPKVRVIGKIVGVIYD